jgi:hypothetical protein
MERHDVRGERRSIKNLWLAFLLVGLSAAAYAATGISPAIDVSVSIWSSDGATLAGGSGGNLITVAGTWTMDDGTPSPITGSCGGVAERVGNGYCA